MLPVPDVQPEAHGRADQLVPPSFDHSTDPTHPSVVGFVTCTPRRAEKHSSRTMVPWENEEVAVTTQLKPLPVSTATLRVPSLSVSLPVVTRRQDDGGEGGGSEGGSEGGREGGEGGEGGSAGGRSGDGGASGGVATQRQRQGPVASTFAQAPVPQSLVPVCFEL